MTDQQISSKYANNLKCQTNTCKARGTCTKRLVLFADDDVGLASEIVAMSSDVLQNAVLYEFALNFF